MTLSLVSQLLVFIIVLSLISQTLIAQTIAPVTTPAIIISTFAPNTTSAPSTTPTTTASAPTTTFAPSTTPTTTASAPTTTFAPSTTPTTTASALTTPLTADPCSTYNVLDDPWTSSGNPNSTQYMCNSFVNFVGWYRLFNRGQSAQLSENCDSLLSCGTQVTLWLNGTHPNVGDGVVTRDVCATMSNDCCYYQQVIQVKACPGGYYVYEIMTPTSCNQPYCAVRIINSSNVTAESTSADNVVGIRMRLSSFSDLTQSDNIEMLLQQIKQELVKYGLPNTVELKLRKLQKT